MRDGAPDEQAFLTSQTWEIRGKACWCYALGSPHQTVAIVSVGPAA
ncbi:MAG: hypothetical protein JWP14_2424 [Frankiales bacterium]|nr:hypothetical protein [Frankiales bacterium]